MRLLQKLMMSFALLIVSVVSFAQAPPTPDGPDPEGGLGDAPIDGYLVPLIIIGVAMIAYVAYKKYHQLNRA